MPGRNYSPDNLWFLWISHQEFQLKQRWELLTPRIPIEDLLAGNSNWRERLLVVVEAGQLLLALLRLLQPGQELDARLNRHALTLLQIRNMLSKLEKGVKKAGGINFAKNLSHGEKLKRGKDKNSPVWPIPRHSRRADKKVEIKNFVMACVRVRLRVRVLKRFQWWIFFYMRLKRLENSNIAYLKIWKICMISGKYMMVPSFSFSFFIFFLIILWQENILTEPGHILNSRSSAWNFRFKWTMENVNCKFCFQQ